MHTRAHAQKEHAISKLLDGQKIIGHYVKSNENK